MILFSAIEHGDCVAAYHWHRGFSSANSSLFPRTFERYEDLVMQGSVWAARDTSGNFLAQAYAAYDEGSLECEIGGLMVAENSRGKGLGATIMRLALVHALLEENILAIKGARIVAHILKGNNDPRGVIEKRLLFAHAKAVEIPQEALPGLKADEDGMIRGDEYEIQLPQTLTALAEWAEKWHDHVNGGSDAIIELRTGVSMELWAKALRDLEHQFS